ncbi:MAG TPA: GNAT family N-acetyltransferase [Pyrinomonadaceae bacterium]|nr:GNAT family N-acetyltransferase [Pyrinomonadaceae bacterium]
METEKVERPLEEGGDVRLRPVEASDEDFLLRVYADSRAEEMRLVPWNDEQKLAFLRSQFEAQREQYQARFPDAEYSVILYREQPAGRLWIGRTDEQIRLLDIAILPEFQNRGIGATLLRKLLAESERTGLPLRHMVFKPNTAALRFYQRFGFKQIDDVGAYIHMERRPDSAAPTSPGATGATTPTDA